jgi:glycine cleavage system H protein
MTRIGSYDFPDDALFDAQGEVWLRKAADGTLVLGLTALSCDFAGEFAIFTPKPAGREYEAGRSVGLLETCKTVGAVKTPVSVRILESNAAVEKRPLLVNEAPYDAGWLFRLQPLDWANERAALVDARGLAARYDTLLARMKGLRDG